MIERGLYQRIGGARPPWQGGASPRALGFDTFGELMGVFCQSSLNGLALFLPPHRPLMGRLPGLMKRF